MAKLIIGENDLKTWCKKNNRENLLIEWDYNANNGLKNKFGWDVSTPDLVMPNSNIKVSWICEKGHKYEARKELLRIPVSEIRYIESSGRYIIVHDSGGEYKLKGKLNDIYERVKGFGFHSPEFVAVPFWLQV